MLHKKSDTSKSSDPLSLEYSHSLASHSRTKSHSSMDEDVKKHFSGLFRVGRVFASVFDRSRQMNYEYKVEPSTTPSTSQRSLPSPVALVATHNSRSSISNKDRTPSESNKTSRTSSTVDFQHYITANGRLSVEGHSSVSSRRGSAESTDSRRARRGGMSVNNTS